MKMADEENSRGAAFVGASERDEPIAKRPKIGPVTHCGIQPIEPDLSSRVCADAESEEAAVNRTEKKEAKPAMMAVEQALAAARGEDNNGLDALGLPVSEPLRSVGKINDSAVFGLTHESAGRKKKFASHFYINYTQAVFSLPTHRRANGVELRRKQNRVKRYLANATFTILDNFKIFI